MPGGIYSVYIISKSGGLIFHHDVEQNFVSSEVEKTFGYPLDIKIDYINQRLTVTFGQRDGIKGLFSHLETIVLKGGIAFTAVGYVLMAINGEPVSGRKLGDADVLNDVLANEANFPINIKFGLPRLTTNEKIVLASMFHSLYAIAALQISTAKRDKTRSSGIEVMETDNFRLNCYQTLTGVKFLVLSDLSLPMNKDNLLKKIYELYSDYALKNPFYSLDMPIRCELFESNLQAILEQTDKYNIINTI